MRRLCFLVLSVIVVLPGCSKRPTAEPGPVAEATRPVRATESAKPASTRPARPAKVEPAAPEKSVQEWIQELKDGDPQARALAAAGLVKLGPKAQPAMPLLIELLKDKHAYVRQNAAQALGAIGPEARTAVPALIELLEDKS